MEKLREATHIILLLPLLSLAGVVYLLVLHSFDLVRFLLLAQQILVNLGQGDVSIHVLEV